MKRFYFSGLLLLTMYFNIIGQSNDDDYPDNHYEHIICVPEEFPSENEVHSSCMEFPIQEDTYDKEEYFLGYFHVNIMGEGDLPGNDLPDMYLYIYSLEFGFDAPLAISKKLFFTGNEIMSAYSNLSINIESTTNLICNKGQSMTLTENDYNTLSLKATVVLNIEGEYFSYDQYGDGQYSYLFDSFEVPETEILLGRINYCCDLSNSIFIPIMRDNNGKLNITSFESISKNIIELIEDSEFPKNKEVKIFPNPFNDFISVIQEDNTRIIKIINANGIDFYNDEKGSNINTVNWPSGLYFLVYQIESRLKSKIIIKN